MAAALSTKSLGKYRKIHLNNSKQRFFFACFALRKGWVFLVGIILVKLLTEQLCKRVSQCSGGWADEIRLVKDLTSKAGTAPMPILPMCAELNL